jgi:hypothetical protein
MLLEFLDIRDKGDAQKDLFQNSSFCVMLRKDAAFFENIKKWFIYKDIIPSSAVIDDMQLLIQFLYQAFEKPVFILVDEFDTPMNWSIGKKDQDQVEFTSQTLQLLCSALTKDSSSYVAKVLFMAVTPAAKEAFFSDSNSIAEFSFFQDSFITSFGFTEEEVRELCEESVVSEQDCLYESIFRYYGYKMKEVVLHNPYSVTKFLSSLQFELFWMNKESLLEEVAMLVIKEEIKNTMVQLLSKFRMRSNQGYSVMLDPKLTFKSLPIHQPSAFWTFLLHTGHLSVMLKNTVAGSSSFEVAIPNQELLARYDMFLGLWAAEVLFGEESVDKLNFDVREHFVDKINLECLNEVLEGVSKFWRKRRERRHFSFPHSKFLLYCRFEFLFFH